MTEYKYLITIFTPTFNRAYTLTKLYKSLLSQTDKNFEWLIIDDGSKDNTEELVQSFIDEKNIPIRYIKKENEGKHTAINIGSELAWGELFFIVDSDDYLTEDAIKNIKEDWEKYKNINDICGIIYLREHKDKSIIGDKFEKDYILSNKINEVVYIKISGDKSEIVKTDIIKNYKFPKYKGEKFLGEDVLWLNLSRRYKFLFVNKAIYVTEYLEDGLSMAGRNLRIKCPYGGMESAKVLMKKDINFKTRFKNYWLYSTYAFFAKIKLKDFYNESENKIMTTLTIPMGFLLYLYWKYRCRK